MADDKTQEQVDREFEETRPAHPVLRAAENKLREVEAGVYMDVARHNEIQEEEGIRNG